MIPNASFSSIPALLNLSPISATSSESIAPYGNSNLEVIVFIGDLEAMN